MIDRQAALRANIAQMKYRNQNPHIKHIRHGCGITAAHREDIAGRLADQTAVCGFLANEADDFEEFLEFFVRESEASMLCDAIVTEW